MTGADPSRTLIGGSRTLVVGADMPVRDSIPV